MKKLTVDQVKEIKSRLRAGERQVDIAADYGVTQMMISYIKTGKKWTHVKVDEDV